MKSDFFYKANFSYFNQPEKQTPFIKRGEKTKKMDSCNENGHKKWRKALLNKYFCGLYRKAL